MAFNIREGIRGLEHLRLAACRRILKMEADHFMPRYAKTALPVEICRSVDGNPVCCERCGFVILKVRFENAWQLEMCSALPVLDINNPELPVWVAEMDGEKVRESSFKTDIQA